MGILAEPNPDRALLASLDGVVYARHPVRTHLVTARDDAVDVVRRYATPLGSDVAFVAVSERMVAITQGRSYPMSSIRPGGLARFLVRFVTRPGYGIGLGTPETMQLAISEIGAPRILLAAAVSGVTKPFGIHGLFYRIAGPQAAAIDGPTSYTIAPYNQAATLGPRDPRAAARRLADALGVPVAVIDANDAGCHVLGLSPGVARRQVEGLFADNPLGQASEQTPICVVHRVTWPSGEPSPPEPKRRITPP
ncbi:MAG: F420-0--gamma-glutamyl ligase [Chloroflexi bacterium]|nr:F420-0--gamma-glutamyl ligase [Chloroflexota bacterium]